MEFIDGVVLIREICGFSIKSLIALFVCTSCLVSIYLLLKEGESFADFVNRIKYDGLVLM